MSLADLWGAPVQTTHVPPDSWTVPVAHLVKLRTAAWELQSLLAHMSDLDAAYDDEAGERMMVVDEARLIAARAAVAALDYVTLSIGPSIADADRIARGEPPMEPEPWTGKTVHDDDGGTGR